MNFTVLWHPLVETALLAAMLRAADKPGDRAVVREIDHRLDRAPHAEGESRDDGFRLPFRRLSQFLSRIDGATRTVHIE